MASLMLQALRPADFTSSGHFTQRSKRTVFKSSNMEVDNNAVAKVLKEMSDSDMFAEAPTASTTSTAKARAGSLSIGRTVKSQPHRVQVLDVDPHLTAPRGLHDATAATSRAKPAATVTTVGGRRRLETTSLVVGVKRPGPVNETISATTDAEQPVKKKKRKSVSWAPDHKLCDVLLFYKDDSRPSQYQTEAPTHEEPVDGPPGFEAAARMEHDQERAWHQRHNQDHVVQEQLRVSHHQQQERKSALAKSGGLSHEEERGAYEALQPQLSWRQPEQLQLLEEWGVADGGDSVERQKQQARESSTPGVVYHSLSEMPASPVEAGDEPIYSESSVTQIPLMSVEDDAQASAQASGPEQTQSVSASPTPREEEPVPQPNTALKVETPQPAAAAAQASSVLPQVSASSIAAQAGPTTPAPTAAEVSGLTNLLTTISHMQAPQSNRDLAAPGASSVASVLAALCSQLPTQQPPQAQQPQAQCQAQTQGQAQRQPQLQPQPHQQSHQQPLHQLQPQHLPGPTSYPSTYVRPQQLPEPAQLSLPQPQPSPQRPPAHGPSAPTSAPPKLMTAAQQVAAALSGNSVATNIDPQLLMQLLSNPTLMADLTKSGGSSSAAKMPPAPNPAATMPPAFPAKPPSMHMFQPPSNPPPGVSGPGRAGSRLPPPLPPGPRPPSVEISRPFGHAQMLPSQRPFRPPPGTPGPGFRPRPGFQHSAGPPLPFDQHMHPPHPPFRPGGLPPPPYAHQRPEQRMPPFEPPPPPVGMVGGSPFASRQKRDPVSKVVCKFFNTPMGCRNGEHCQFLHEPWGL